MERINETGEKALEEVSQWCDIDSGEVPLTPLVLLQSPHSRNSIKNSLSGHQRTWFLLLETLQTSRVLVSFKLVN